MEIDVAQEEVVAEEGDFFMGGIPGFDDEEETDTLGERYVFFCRIAFRILIYTLFHSVLNFLAFKNYVQSF